MLVGWEDEPTLLLRTFKKIFYLVLLKKNTMLFHADRMSLEKWKARTAALCALTSVSILNSDIREQIIRKAALWCCSRGARAVFVCMVSVRIAD